MSVLNDSLLLGADAGGGAYQISRSLRFNRGDSASLSRTPGTAGNRTTWTWSGWVKRTAFGENGQTLFTGGTNASNSTRLSFDTSNRLVFENEISGATTQYRATTALFRDPGAWMHIVLAVDTTLATAVDRVKLWINGAQVTTFDANNAPTQNLQLQVNAANIHYIGQSFTPAYANFYLAEVYHVDGLALQASNFGEFDATTGVWNPKTATGITSYGTCGFRLTFSDNSAATATTLGKDAAGSNNWTPTNFSVTAGAGNDSLVDTPTSYGTDTGAGGEVRGNYCTWNPLTTTSTTLSDGNLQTSGSVGSGCVSTFVVPSSGKYYCEVTITTTPENGQTECVGVGPIDSASELTRVHNSAGQYYNGASWVSLGSAWSINDVIGIGLNADAGQISFYRNGTIQGSAQSYSFTSKDCVKIRTRQSGTSTFVANFGQRPFAYTAPSGFKALCTANLPTPTIANGATAMDVKLYTGNGSTQTISGLGFSPDLVWIKSRSNGARDHAWYDIIRGVAVRLESNNTDAEIGPDSGLSSFTGDGFSLGTNGQVNANTETFAAWCWDAGSSTVTNTQGSITSQVRANASAGFSIVTYTGIPAGPGTIGHGLNSDPSMIIVKRRNASSEWLVYMRFIQPGQYLRLNATSGASPDSLMWNSTSPTSTVFSVGQNADTNQAAPYVAYCFAPVAGYSAFGSYTGNGSSDGPFVYTGFRPRWAMVKYTSNNGSWGILDSERGVYNVNNKGLAANESSAEFAYLSFDFTSNGFKLRTIDSYANASNGTYIYAAFAESPFQFSRAR